jgi:uncharacterized protein YbjT (DUF2867 family)
LPWPERPAGSVRFGSLTLAALERNGHQVRRISLREGAKPALTGVDVVIDAVNSTASDRAESVAFLTTTTRNLLGAKKQAGARHHVALSIAVVHKVEGNAHYAGKRAQEAAVAAGPVPYTIVSSTQFTISRSWSPPGRRRTVRPWCRRGGRSRGPDEHVAQRAGCG